MKTLKTLIVAALLSLSFNSFASEDPNTQKLSMNYALKTYIDAITEGKVKGFAEILDNDVKFTVTIGQKIVNYTRSEVLNSLNQTLNINQNCVTEHTIVEQNPSQVIVKVSMKYDAFTRINYVSMAQTTKGWKITNVSSVFI